MVDESVSYVLGFRIGNIREYKDSVLSFSFMPCQRVYDDVEADSAVSRLMGSIYDSKVIAISGINASGKTTLLSTIYFIIGVYLCNRSLDDAANRRLLSRFYDDKAIGIEVVLMTGGRIYLVRSSISRKGERFVFADETVYAYSRNVFSRKNLEDPSNYTERMSRGSLSDDQRSFLEDGKSIAFAIVDKTDSSMVFSFQETREPDLNEVVVSSGVIIRYLDSSIERLERKDGNAFALKRKGQEEKALTYSELLSTLSSGTLKGIGFFTKLLTVLRYGGYVLIDEIEDHFNKTIVMNILEFFMRRSTNPHGAHIIFTTHYQELLDILPRNDGVYITTRRDGVDLSVYNLAEFLKRRDIKRSDILASDYYDLGTAIDYGAYSDLLKSVAGLVDGEDFEMR